MAAIPAARHERSGQALLQLGAVLCLCNIQNKVLGPGCFIVLVLLLCFRGLLTG